jgi:hypothetical protein
MKPESRSNIYAVMGIASLLLGGYALRQALRYIGMTSDSVGASIFALAGVSLLVVAIVHFYMATGYRFGQLEAVTGSLNCATLMNRSGVIAEGVRIRFLGKPDEDNLSTAPNSRYVFFVSGWRPWVCPVSGFLRE